MAVLRWLLTALLLSAASASYAHMGRTIQLLYPDGVEESLAANLVAAYMGEQMGREIVVESRRGPTACLDGILAREAPMALVPEDEGRGARDGLVRMGDPVRVGSRIYVLIMGREAADQLRFSLVSTYLRTLSERLAGIDPGAAISSIEGGSGARKVALDLLRKGDII